MKTSKFADASRVPLLAAAFLAVLIRWGAPAPALADDYHYKSLLVGNRAAGMAGAFTAVSDDPTGLYYNPAGIVYTNGANVSASSNAFQYTRTKYEDAIGKSDWTRSSSTLLPNFFGAVQPIGPVTVGLSYAVPDSVNENLDQEFSNLQSIGLDRFVINLNQLDNTYLFGPSVAFGNGPFAFGVTLYAYHRHWEITMNQWIKKADTVDAGGLITQKGMKYQNTMYFENTEDGVRPIVGLMYSPTDYLSIGLSGARTFVLNSSATRQVSVMYENSADDTRSEVGFAKSDERREYPWTLNAGIAWYPDPSLMLTADFSWYSITYNDDYPDAEPTWNASVGCEYYLNSSWALRGGLYTNNANTLKLKKGYVDQDPHINEYGATISAGYFSKGSSIELGLGYARGMGEDQIIGGETAIQDVITDSISLYLSASYAF